MKAANNAFAVNPFSLLKKSALMKVAVLAKDSKKEEMQQKLQGTKAEIFWADSIDELISNRDPDAYFDLEFVPEKDRINDLKKCLPKPVFINSLIETLNDIGGTFIRINAWNGFLNRTICEAVSIDETQKINATKIFEELGWDYRFVPDLSGMITARIVAMIINEAYFTLQDEVSTKAEIDIAMKLGTNYPYGPFEWSEKIGLKNIYELLKTLSKTDMLYKPSELMEKEILIL